MKRSALLGFVGLFAIGVAHAQVVPQPGPPMPAACAYNDTPPTLTNGQAGWNQCDSTGSQLVVQAASSSSTAGATVISTAALAANLVVKASAGNLYSFEVSATPTLYAAPWWIMIYNAASAPVDGAVTPAKCYAMPSGSTAFSAAFPTPAVFSTGITIGVSTTGCFSKTASTQAFISGDFK